MLWHKLITSLEPHFQDVGEISPFYYNTLLDSAKKWEKQSAKRLTVETLINILKYEGRLQSLSNCIMCNQKIENDLSLVDGFLPTHSSCSHQEPMNINAVKKLFNESSTILFDDEVVERLYLVALKSF